LITNRRRVSPPRHVAWLLNTVRFQSARFALPRDALRTLLQDTVAPAWRCSHRLLPPTPVAVSRRVTGGAFTLLAMARAILRPDNNRERDRPHARDATDASICALMLLVCACREARRIQLLGYSGKGARDRDAHRSMAAPKRINHS